MSKQFISVFVVLFMLSSAAFTQKSIKGLVNAEKSFASFTDAHSIRDGFLQFMDSAGIVFRDGAAVNALDAFQKQKPGPGKLSWWPTFAVISASGDLGFTSGPFEFRAGSIDDTVSDRGSFSSVWHTTVNGTWKNMLDLGISYNHKYAGGNEIQETILSPKTTNNQFEDVLAVDRKFNTDLHAKNSDLVMASISADCWLNIDGELPVKGIKPINAALMKLPETVILGSLSGNISAAGDLAYVYGTVIIGDKKENYLRGWVYRSDKWQVILQTIKMK